MDQKTARPGTPSLRSRAPLALGERREKGPRAFPRRWAEEGSETCVEVVKFSALALTGEGLERKGGGDGRFLITVSISVLVMGLLRFSISSWSSFGPLGLGSSPSHSYTGPGSPSCSHKAGPDPSDLLQRPLVLEPGPTAAPQVPDCVEAFQGRHPQGGEHRPPSPATVFPSPGDFPGP